jgi:hypothetical protein
VGTRRCKNDLHDVAIGCPRCPECAKATAQRFYARHHARIRQQQSEYHRMNRGKIDSRTAARQRSAKMRSRYGIDVDEYDALSERQCHACAICGERAQGESLDVDHDHVTGKVRGLLCRQCNQGLGLFKDDPTRLWCATAYLSTRPTHQEV